MAHQRPSSDEEKVFTAGSGAKGEKETGGFLKTEREAGDRPGKEKKRIGWRNHLG